MSSSLKKDDVVIVIRGKHRLLPEERRTGKVLSFNHKTLRVTVEGVNVRRSTVKRSQRQPGGGFVEKEGSIHRSNVMLKSEYDARKAKRSTATNAAAPAQA